MLKPKYQTILTQAREECNRSASELATKLKCLTDPAYKAAEFMASGMAFRIDCAPTTKYYQKLNAKGIASECQRDVVAEYLKRKDADQKMLKALYDNTEMALEFFKEGIAKEELLLMQMEAPTGSHWNPERWLKEFEEGKKKKETHPARIKVWEDTIKVVQTGYYNLDADKVVYPQFSRDITDETSIYQHELPQIEPAERFTMPILVHRGDCLEVTRRLHDIDETDDLCVLNLASGRNPGGGVNKGSGAQEEYLFRCTDYFRSLFQYTSRFDPMQYGIPKAKEGYPLDRNFGGCYSHGVTVFRDTEAKGYAYLADPWKVNFVAAAVSRLPCLYSEIPSSEVPMVINTIRTILRISYINGQRRLVLGALGCGAFNYPPKHMARLFRQVLDEPEFKGTFREVHFAIFDDHNAARKGESNVDAFAEVFGNGVQCNEGKETIAPEQFFRYDKRYCFLPSAYPGRAEKYILYGDICALVAMIRNRGKYGLFHLGFNGMGGDIDRYYSDSKTLFKYDDVRICVPAPSYDNKGYVAVKEKGMWSILRVHTEKPTVAILQGCSSFEEARESFEGVLGRKSPHPWVSFGCFSNSL